MIGLWQILELGELIRTNQITSHELVQIFLQRLKRYAKEKYTGVLSILISNFVNDNDAFAWATSGTILFLKLTDELAYKQAKEADELIAKGVYLGILPVHFYYNLGSSIIFSTSVNVPFLPCWWIIKLSGFEGSHVGNMSLSS